MAVRIEALQRGYLRAAEGLAALAMAAIVVILSLQVFYRYGLGNPLAWPEETSRCLLIWMCFLFAGAAFQRGDMAAIDMAISKVPFRLRAMLIVPAYLVAAGLAGLLVYYGWRYAQQNRLQLLPGVSVLFQSVAGRGATVSIFWLYLSVPVGFTILAMHMIASAARILAAALTPSAPSRGQA